MKLHQVVAILSFVAAGASATPGGYGDKDKDVKYGNNYGNKYGNNYGNKYGNNYGDKYGKDGKDKYGHGKDGYGKDGHGKDGHGKDGKDGDKYGHGKDGYGKDGDKYGHGKDGYGYGHGKDKCKTYEWDIGRCNWCPYKPYHPRDLDGLEARGDYGYGNGYGYGHGKTCKKTCPETKKKCKSKSPDYSKPTYAGDFEESVWCEGGDSYKVKGKIGPCGDWGKYGSKQCLFVEYADWDKWSDKDAYLGIYTTESGVPKKKKDLNLTDKYCKKNKCVVPLDKFPGWPKLCGKSVWIGIDDDQCKPKKGHGYGGYGKDGHNKDGKDGKKYGHDDDKYGKDKDGKDKYGHDDDKYGKDKYGNNNNNYGNGNKDKRGNDDKYGNNNNYGNNYGNNNYGDKDGNKDGNKYGNNYGNNYGDNDDSNNYGTDRYGSYGRNYVKAIELDITCTYPKKCTAWCCCG
ncbi:hypothetical protein CEP54_013767 [Fusarium duplospermum]|uniref:Uncharacterized protein n=1 Tax=Fusarium duplospermum TaxID=1325734 RepID=A0A428P0S7_9HYPO|nr:hypothetical protein CEP54_013767 [Fusarium duplospermum]